MAEDKSGTWRWYHHVIVVVATFAYGFFYTYVWRPSDRTAAIVGIICAVGLAVLIPIIQIRKRRARKP